MMKRLLFLGLFLSPVVLMAQKKEELQSIQRDVAQMQEQIKQLQHSQDEKMSALQSLIQQALETSNKMAQNLTAFEKDVSSKLNDQQNKLGAPVATMGSKVDQMSDDFRSVATNVADLVRRMGALDSKLADISSAIRTLSTPAAPPPQAAQSATPAGPPAGMSAETSFQSAFRDYMGGKDSLAMQEFNEYLKWFADTENGPGAEYYIGMLYSRAQQYDDAVKAFDAVLERWPENPRTPEALYYKAVSLMQGAHKTEAGKVFKEFIQRYPRSEHVTAAHQNLKSLGLESRTSVGKKRE
jgi:TolA-binding protein